MFVYMDVINFHEVLQEPIIMKLSNEIDHLNFLFDRVADLLTELVIQLLVVIDLMHVVVIITAVQDPITVKMVVEQDIDHVVVLLIYGCKINIIIDERIFSNHQN